MTETQETLAVGLVHDGDGGGGDGHEDGVGGGPRREGSGLRETERQKLKEHTVYKRILTLAKALLRAGLQSRPPRSTGLSGSASFSPVDAAPERSAGKAATCAPKLEDSAQRSARRKKRARSGTRAEQRAAAERAESSSSVGRIT